MRNHPKRVWIATTIAVVAVIILFFGGSLWQFFFGSSAPSGQAPTSGPVNTIEPTSAPKPMNNISTVQGLEIYDETVGTGAEAVAGKDVTVHYVGVLQNGTKFDSSVDRGQPFTFSLGAGQVIKGWDLGVVGMKVGGTRRLVISPELAYGNRAIGSIPANSTLIFQVQLLDVK